MASVIWMGSPRPGSSVLVMITGAAPGAGISWRVATGSGTVSPISAHADDAGQAGARYNCADAEGATVRVEVDVYA